MIRSDIVVGNEKATKAFIDAKNTTILGKATDERE